MKSQFQTLSFLSNYTPKTGLDTEFIESFLVQRFQITPKTPRYAPDSNGAPLDVQSFISWFENGSAALEIARHNNQTVLLGNCTLENYEIIGTLLSDDSIDLTSSIVPAEQISKASESEIKEFQEELWKNGLQPDPNTLKLIPKYTPELANRVIFYDFAQDVQGVGVVREVTAEGDVIFFCYFTYQTYSNPKRIGYSLYENPGVNLASYVLESIDPENIPTTLGNSTSCYRRLGRELEKVGTVWKDKMLRIEPINGQVAVGEKYYYISDKMKVVSDTEKGTPTSKLRWLAGNYFITHMAATKMLGKWNEDLRNYMASDKWPDIEN